MLKVLNIRLAIFSTHLIRYGWKSLLISSIWEVGKADRPLISSLLEAIMETIHSTISIF